MRLTKHTNSTTCSTYEYHCDRVSLPETDDELLDPGGLVALAPQLRNLGNPKVTFKQPEFPFWSL